MTYDYKMKQIFLSILLFFCTSAKAADDASELALEFYLDSLMIANDVDYLAATAQFLEYAKKNYKNIDNVKDFVDYSSKKMKTKDKEYSKNFTKELDELYSYAIVAHNNLNNLEKKIYSIFEAEKTKKSNFAVGLYLAIHEMNYWGLNSYKPNQLGYKLTKLYNSTTNVDLAEKLSLFIFAAKIYKASYYVNPMHLCETHYANTEIINEIDSLNLNTNNITIDSIPEGIKPPTFIGGLEKLNSYVQQNLRYPEKAISAGHQGRVIVSFKVDENGDIFDPKIKKSTSEYLSKEALRIVKSLPKWQTDSKTLVGAGFTKFTMPFSFVLPEG